VCSGEPGFNVGFKKRTKLRKKMTPEERKGYEERVRVQTLRWAMGQSKHNRFDDECVPDFSCCFPDLLETNQEKRWATYLRTYKCDAPKGPEKKAVLL
jgi:hypothetical protein